MFPAYERRNSQHHLVASMQSIKRSYIYVSHVFSHLSNMHIPPRTTPSKQGENSAEGVEDTIGPLESACSPLGTTNCSATSGKLWLFLSSFMLVSSLAATNVSISTIDYW